MDVEDQVVDALSNRERLQFPAGVGVEHDHVAAAAADKQALVCSSRAMATLFLARVTGQDAATVFFQRSITLTRFGSVR